MRQSVTIGHRFSVTRWHTDTQYGGMNSVIDTVNAWADALELAVEREVIRLLRAGYALDELEQRTVIGRPGRSEIWARGKRVALVSLS